MDHPLYDYQPLPERRKAMAGGLCAFVVLFLEHWDLVPPPGALRDPRMVGEFGSFTPDYRSWSQREYGLRVGIFRLVDALREAGIRPAIAANSMAVQRLPTLVRSFNDWGCEWIAHGQAATRMMHANMALDVQRRHIDSSISTLEQVTGRRPLGWLSQDWGTSPDTFTLLAEAGVRYTLDWCNDDQPYALHTRPPMLALPLSAEWDDVQCQWLRNLEPRAHTALALSAFARLHAECGEQGRGAVFGLGLHPWLSGMSSRIAACRTLLAGMKTHAGVRWLDPYELLASQPGE